LLGLGAFVTLPKLSIAAKLYAIFALMATTTLALSTIAVFSARNHVVLTQQFETANTGRSEVERVKALIYAVFSNTRAIYTAPDQVTSAKYAAELLHLGDQIGAVVTKWQRAAHGERDTTLSGLAGSVSTYREFLKELARTATEGGPAAARAWARANSIVDVRSSLDESLEKLGRQYGAQADAIYDKLNSGIDHAALLLSLMASFAVLLAVAGAVVIARQIVNPLAEIARVTEAVAGGDTTASIPHSERRDEIGALARAIGIFQSAMSHNAELNRTVREDADSRARRQEQVSGEIARFSAEIEAALAELGRISDQMLAASGQLAGAADHAAAKTESAATASAEASSNVRDIASAADELSASVNEIDRQVAQSNAIAGKAVSEAGRTNVAVKELDDAASRIGDVVKLITDIAEQTNLLALNATIEAARAGDAGRGFAVVASEVKALAGQTGRATEEISAQIVGMQRATQRSIDAINSIEQIIREMGDISGAIAAAVTEQGAATQEIARSVDIAAKRTAETANEVGLVGAATDDTRTSASTVKSVADDLGQAAQRIRAQVDQFFDRLSA
jgi:methyl-accepting chemotaxis protein